MRPTKLGIELSDLIEFTVLLFGDGCEFRLKEIGWFKFGLHSKTITNI